MTSPAADQGAEGALRLPESLDYAAAPDFAKTLRARRGAALTLDAADLRQIGASCAQLLVAAARAWRVDRRALAVSGLTDEAAAQLRLMGIDRAMITADAAERTCAL